MPEPVTELHYDSPFHLLVAVILSAQCTDKRVNQITPALFEAYPDVLSMANAEVGDIFGYIKSCSYPNNKARALKAMAQRLHEEFADRLPDELKSLTSLPGVGRKTANVILAVIFGKAAMAVDTHVYRVSRRIGLVSRNCTTPLAVEKALTRHMPAELIPDAHHWLILHGRYTCVARKPKCGDCGLTAVCRHYIANHKPT